jgi:parvulin-like peptidyl-prolyl isomerase
MKVPGVKYPVLSIAVCLLLSVQASPQIVIDEIIAKVNSDIILKSDVDRQEALLRREIADGSRPPAEAESLFAAERGNLLRNLIDESLLTWKASEYDLDTEANLQVLRTWDRIRQENGFESTEELEAAVLAQGDSPEDIQESIRSQYLSEQVLNREVRSRIVITTEELRAYYDEHRQEFDRPRGVNLAEIVKVIGGVTSIEAGEIRAEMDAIHERLVDGEDFFEIAEAESQSTTASGGGILGYFGDGMLGPEFEQAASQLARNQISGVFEVGDALVIIKMLERHEGGILSFELARRELETLLLRERETPRIREYLTRLRRDGFLWIRDGYADSGAAAAAPQPDDASDQ